MKGCAVLLLTLIAGAGTALASDTTWESSESNGCKPGIGFRITKTAQGYTGTGYLLSPDHPHDFAKGVARKMKVTRSETREMKFQIDWGDGNERSCKFSFDADLDSKPVKGTLTEDDRKDAAGVYIFKPVKPK